MADADVIALAVKDPDAAAAKKLLAELEALAPVLAQARAELAELCGEARHIVPPAPAMPSKRGIPTPLGRSFFLDAEALVARMTVDAAVVLAQVRGIPPKV